MGERHLGEKGLRARFLCGSQLQPTQLRGRSQGWGWAHTWHRLPSSQVVMQVEFTEQLRGLAAHRGIYRAIASGNATAVTSGTQCSKGCSPLLLVLSKGVPKIHRAGDFGRFLKAATAAEGREWGLHCQPCYCVLLLLTV